MARFLNRCSVALLRENQACSVFRPSLRGFIEMSDHLLRLPMSNKLLAISIMH